jgi:hypothetical protein
MAFSQRVATLCRPAGSVCVALEHPCEHISRRRNRAHLGHSRVLDAERRAVDRLEQRGAAATPSLSTAIGRVACSAHRGAPGARCLRRNVSGRCSRSFEADVALTTLHASSRREMNLASHTPRKRRTLCVEGGVEPAHARSALLDKLVRTLARRSLMEVRERWSRDHHHVLDLSSTTSNVGQLVASELPRISPLC